MRACAILLLAACTASAPPDALVLGRVPVDDRWLLYGGDAEVDSPANLWLDGDAMARAGGRRLYDACSLSRGRVLVVGFGGAALEGDGRAWRTRDDLGSRWLAGIDAAGSDIWIVGGGDTPTVLRSVDDGRNFHELAAALPPGARDLRDVRVSGPGVALIVGNGGLLAKTTDGGASFTRVVTGTDAWLRALDVQGERVAVGGNGVLLVGPLDDLRVLPLPGEKVNAVRLDGDRTLVATMAGRLLEVRADQVRTLAEGDGALTAITPAPEGGFFVDGDRRRLMVD